MNQKINETCKNYLEIETLENIDVFKSASKGPFGFLYTPIRQYDRPHEQENTASNNDGLENTQSQFS